MRIEDNIRNVGWFTDDQLEEYISNAELDTLLAELEEEIIETEYIPYPNKELLYQIPLDEPCLIADERIIYVRKKQLYRVQSIVLKRILRIAVCLLPFLCVMTGYLIINVEEETMESNKDFIYASVIPVLDIPLMPTYTSIKIDRVLAKRNDSAAITYISPKSIIHIEAFDEFEEYNEMQLFAAAEKWNGEVRNYDIEIEYTEWHESTQREHRILLLERLPQFIDECKNILKNN